MAGAVFLILFAIIAMMIGAGLRAPPQLLLFEKLINLVHERAPTATICFNTTPADTVEAVQRSIPGSA